MIVLLRQLFQFFDEAGLSRMRAFGSSDQALQLLNVGFLGGGGIGVSSQIPQIIEKGGISGMIPFSPVDQLVEICGEVIRGCKSTSG
jgi:hypothetical protein